MSTRRNAVRVTLFEPAWLRGGGSGVRCAVIDLSATGARLTLNKALPRPPLRLEFELGDQQLELKIEVKREAEGGHLAVAFIDPPVDHLHRLIAAEQRYALAAGRLNVRDRRTQPPTPGTRGEVLP